MRPIRSNIANMQTCAIENSDVSWSQEITLLKLFSTPWMTYNSLCMIGLNLSLGHLYNNFGTKKVAKWQSQPYLWKYTINYCISLKEFLITHACMFAMLLLMTLHLSTPQAFLVNISLLFVNKYYYFVETYKQTLLWSLILKNSSQQFFFNFQYRVVHQLI